MKKKASGKLVITILAFAIVLVYGALAYAGQDCPTRWGEPIGVNCDVSNEVSSVNVKNVVADEEALTECKTRWGEPVGIGCRVPYTVAVVEAGDLLGAGELYTSCPTRWGEPIGVNCGNTVEN